MGGPGSGRRPGERLCKTGCTCGVHNKPHRGPCPVGCRCELHTHQRGDAISHRLQTWHRSLSPQAKADRAKAISGGNPRSSTSGRLGWTGGRTGAEFAHVLCPVGYVREFQVNWGPGHAAHYKLDFAHPTAKVNIELDGPYHDPSGDEVRDLRLRALGWKVIRISHD
jgi:hypothetical protein